MTDTADSVPDIDVWFVQPFFEAALAAIDEEARPRARSDIEDISAGRLAEATDLVPDPQAYLHAGCAALALALHRWIRANLPDADPLALVRRAAIEPFADSMRDAARTTLDEAADPFATMAATSRSQEESFYGAGFAFERVVDTLDRYLGRAHACVYHALNTRFGVPELTAVWCEWDLVWLGAVDPARHGFTARRPETIGRGADHCDFGFERVRTEGVAR
jgi:hypothetical protein